jgi:pilus assembly protein CpaF
MALHKIIEEIHRESLALPIETSDFGNNEALISRSDKFKKIVADKCRSVDPISAIRIQSEFNGWGPLENLILDEEITEIIVNQFDSVWFEKSGKLFEHNDHFASIETYQLFIDRICQEAGTYFTKEKPTADGKIRDFRLHLISEELTRKGTSLSLRRHPKNPWTISSLVKVGFLTALEAAMIEKVIFEKENFIVIGSTGSGKTSLLGACLRATLDNERSLIIEDTDEISPPNRVSNKLLTRNLAQGNLPPIDQCELLRQTLRMRPDRIILGEIRGAEAKDFLMAISTGHRGSFATLHAHDPQQALLRLEMLIQLAAPQWSLTSIRTLIYLGLKYIFIAAKNENGRRNLAGIYKICSREESGLLLERMI